MLNYTHPELVTAVHSEQKTPRNPYVSGYGSKIPTRHWMRYNGYWYRVYVMSYSNSGVAYILARGEMLIVDMETEARFYEHQV